jgi:hypothetical protein
MIPAIKGLKAKERHSAPPVIAP